MSKQDKVAECILAVEPEIDFPSIKAVNLFLISGDKAVRMSPYYLYLIAQISKMRELGVDESAERLSKLERGEFEFLDGKGLAEAAEALKTSRIRFSMLLDTSGGPGWYQANLETIKNHVERTGGDFAAYGGVDVHSLGANLLMMAPKELRFAHPCSSILFHLGTPDPRAKISKRDQQRSHKESQKEIRDLLLSEASPDQRGNVRKKLDENLLAKNPKTPDRQVAFSGKMAGEWGMLKTLSAESMARHLLERHKLPSGVLKLDLIRQFFDELVAYERGSRQQIQKLLAIFEAADDENDE
jgi:hypothetical protein